MFLLSRKVIYCIDFTLLSKVAAAGVIPDTLLLPKVLDALLIHLFFCVLYSLPLQGQMGFIIMQNWMVAAGANPRNFIAYHHDLITEWIHTLYTKKIWLNTTHYDLPLSLKIQALWTRLGQPRQVLLTDTTCPCFATCILLPRLMWSPTRIVIIVSCGGAKHLYWKLRSSLTKGGLMWHFE